MYSYLILLKNHKVKHFNYILLLYMITIKQCLSPSYMRAESEDTMKKVLWFSRHEMTPEQRAALGDVEVTQINRTVDSAYELQEDINDSDIIAIVAPINLQQQFLKLAEGKPVIMAVNDRVLVPQPDGEDKVEFHFVKWEQLDEIVIKKHDFVVE